MFIAGGLVRGGQVFGKFPNRYAECDDGCPLNIDRRGRLIPTMPWEGVWKGVAEWFGVVSERLDEILPNAKLFEAEGRWTQEDISMYHPDKPILDKDELFKPAPPSPPATPPAPPRPPPGPRPQACLPLLESRYCYGTTHTASLLEPADGAGEITFDAADCRAACTEHSERHNQQGCCRFTPHVEGVSQRSCDFSLGEKRMTGGDWQPNVDRLNLFEGSSAECCPRRSPDGACNEDEIKPMFSLFLRTRMKVRVCPLRV